MLKKRRENYIFKIILMVILDIFICICSSFLGFYLIKKEFYDIYSIYLTIFNILVLILFYTLIGLYRSILRYASIIEMLKIICGVVFIYIIDIIMLLVANRMDYFSYVTVYVMTFFILMGMTRFFSRSYRFIFVKKGMKFFKNNMYPNVMIVGAGDACQMIIKELFNSDRIGYNVKCLIDDDKLKYGKMISGVKVVGNRHDIPKMVIKYDIKEIIIAIPSAKRKDRANIINLCKETNCKVRILPGIYQLINGTFNMKSIRDVDVVDLLGRDQVSVNINEIIGYIKNKVILVTGGGGSIGSELCRQIAYHGPKQLIIVDIYENNAYEIEQELKRKLPDLNLVTLIASIRDRGKIEDIFKIYHPDIVFNAAAHKHVPLMETSPHEAIKNNVFGTLNVAQMADKYGTKRFVQISTDKAVNPTNIMGASKRICEMIIQTIGKNSKICQFVAVRFGNVLGSNGSVIPLFKKQLAEGGPITVTDKDIIRYFMTISEAVSLVLQAGAYAKGGEIYVLDMGEPVKIYDLAYNLIKLSGLIPNKDIDIKITGLRPGEKLYEERLMAEEGLKKTSNGLINIAKPIKIDENGFYNELNILYEKAYQDESDIKAFVKEIVPTYNVYK